MRYFKFILHVLSILAVVIANATTSVSGGPASISPNGRVHVHHMHRASVTRSSPIHTTDSPQTTTMAAIESDNIAKRDDMPTISESTSYSYSLAIPNADKTSEARKDPYIYSSSLPENLVFVVVGAIIGFILLCLVVYRIAAYILSNRRAKADREVYFNSSYNSGSTFGSESSNSSMLEKSSLGSVSSLHLLSRHNSLLQLQHETDNNTMSASQQGRTYRNAVSDNKTNRGSMFISPVLELMNNKSGSQLELPLYHKNASEVFNHSLMSIARSLIMLDSPVYENFPSNMTNNSSTDQLLSQSQLDPQPKLKRPPSMVLDNLIN